MTGAAIKQELERRSEPAETQELFGIIERKRPTIEKMLPAGVTPDDLERIVRVEAHNTPELLACSPNSVVRAVMLALRLGLEPGPLGHVYLVPFKRQVEFIVGYKGYVHLAYESDRVRDIVARTVYENEPFEYEERDTGPRLRHTILAPAERGKERCWYARARLVNAGSVVQVLYPEEVEAHKARSPAGRKGVGPWQTDYDAMARKTCIRVMAPYLPLSSLATKAAARDEQPVADIEIEPESEDE